MRIGMITGEYPPMEGGVGAYTRELARALVSSGSEVFIFTRAEARNASSELDVTGVITGKWGWRSNHLARNWLSEKRIDIVNIQFETAAYNMHPAINFLPGMLPKTPTITTFHDLKFPYLFPKAGKIRYELLKKTARDSQGVVNTERIDEKTVREEWGISHTRFIPIGSNITADFSRQAERNTIRQRLQVDERDLLICYFGFLNESKGALDLIAAVHQLHAQGAAVKLLMIGGRAGASDPANYAYGQLVDEAIMKSGLESSVRWTGFVSDDEVSGFFFASDICALPYRDGVSLRRGTLMAALAHGLPIITTEALTPSPELAGALLTVPIASPRKLADAIHTLAEDKHMKAGLSTRALEAAKRFSWAGIAQQILAFYQEVNQR